ncbi:MAG: hypothetical protein ABH864_00950 [archaeon]
MGLFKRKEVPAELPSLAVDEVKRVDPSPSLVPQPQPQVHIREQPVSYKPLPVAETPKSDNASGTVSGKDESGYFKNLVKSITEETEDLDKLSSWYKNKFMPGDMVFQMREYWQKQQPELMLKNISGELKQKLAGKTEKLHALEKEWQEVYFNLLSKEEEIRKEEKELKDSLAEFIGMLKGPLGKEDK